MRLNKFLANAGVASRRHADELIEEGKVKINGKIVKEMGKKVDPQNDKIEVNGRLIQASEAQPEVVTYLLNKPKGVITTAHDEHGRKTVLDFIPAKPRVFPCGRLDEETMGLVILTNDGNLCYQLTHPKFEHQKEYLVEGSAREPEKALAKLSAGPIQLKDGPASIDELRTKKISGRKVAFYVTIHEGRNRLVRRLCTAVGIEIIHLTRLRVGDYALDGLAPGEYKQL